jgi:hypothetical protein
MTINLGSKEVINKETSTDKEEGKTDSQYTFCSAKYCKTIIAMMEKHYCANMSIPEYTASD